MPSVRIDADVWEKLGVIRHYLKKSGLRGATYSDAIRWLFSVSKNEIELLREEKHKVVKEIRSVQR